MEQRCDTCRFFERNEPEEDGKRSVLGDCHRYPPAAKQQPDPEFDGVADHWANVMDSDWCGEWQSKAAAEALEKLEEGLRHGKDQG